MILSDIISTPSHQQACAKASSDCPAEFFATNETLPIMQNTKETMLRFGSAAGHRTTQW